MNNLFYARYPRITHRGSYASFLNIPKSMTKIAIFIFVFVNFPSFGNSTASAQQVNLELKNAKLTQAFASIREQTGYLFSYKNDEVDKYKVTLSIKDGSIEQAMDACVKGIPLAYVIKEKLIVVYPKANRIMETINQQQKPIIGKVVDEDGNPIMGANIWAEEIRKGTITDEKGAFSLDAGTIKELKIRITFIGYRQRTSIVNNESVSKIILEKSNEQLKEVIISTGYQNISPERFVGAASTVDKNLIERSTSTDIISRIDGVTNGLLVNNASSSPAERISIRGVSSIRGASDITTGTATKNPLIILDDFPFYGDVNTINPNDIESVSILKDAVATSIWGARAANGVIVLTSKKGMLNSKTSINISSNFNISSKPDLNYFPKMSIDEFVEVEKFLFDKGYYDVYLAYPFVSPITPIIETLNKERNGELSHSETEQIVKALKGHSLNDDYEKYVIRNRSNFQNFISLNGGSSQIGYNISFGSDNGKSNIKGPGGLDRYTLNSNISIKVRPKIKLATTINYTNQTIDADGPGYQISPGGGKTELYPYAKLADENGKPLSIPKNYSLPYIESLGNEDLLDWTYKPLVENGIADSKLNTQTLLLNLGVHLNFTPWLDGQIKYQYTKQSTTDDRNYSLESFYARDLINQFTNSTTSDRAIPVGGVYDNGIQSISSHNLRGQINFSKLINEIHDIRTMVVGEITTANNISNFNRIYGYDDKNLSSASNIDYATTFTTFFGTRMRIPTMQQLTNRSDRFVSFLANASYTYNSKYSIYLSARKDGSNLLGVNTNNKWKPLWSIGLKWDVLNEVFMKKNLFSHLNLRSTIGYSGNVNNSISALTTILTLNPNHWGQRASAIKNTPNPDLRWEESRTFNLGVDIGFLSDRISASFDYYRKRSSDLISDITVDPTTGISTVVKNAANLKGNGFELALNSTNIDGKFKWKTSLNSSYAKTIVTEFFGSDFKTPTGPTIREGKIYGVLYAYKWAGLDPETGDPRGIFDGEISKDYRTIFNDSASNQQYIGSSIPLLFGNLLNTISFNNIRLSFNITYKFKYYFRKPVLQYDQLYSSWVTNLEFRDRWKQKGDELRTTVPSMPYPFDSNRDNFYEFASINYEKGDNIRLNDIRLSYNWINTRKSKIPIESLQIFAYVNNLNLFIYKSTSTGYDPDFPTRQIPNPRSYSIGLKINL
ncbi:hypothetical protein COR50_18380 [Chitinophaga caeni]|uniref:TonB-dependent receptor plug domain-containing protein n=1 Tax=Chitinophaga caeni TaxID=2029983 RepID=A0A291QYG0_9BACT|nr:SusC/RagA family TonB-linked outer membrane protein [Chitinophaga caeni]ATL48978.1 hypothetical protein COR50_18380 [Chitinophaga caeni]